MLYNEQIEVFISNYKYIFGISLDELIKILDNDVSRLSKEQYNTLLKFLHDEIIAYNNKNIKNNKSELYALEVDANDNGLDHETIYIYKMIDYKITEYYTIVVIDE